MRIKFNLIHGISAKRAAKIATARLQVIRNLYEPAPTPYKGQITDLALCPDNRKSQTQAVDILGKKTPVLVGYVTARYTFGACHDSEIKNIGSYTGFYVKSSKTLVQVTIFKSRGPLPKDRKFFYKVLEEFHKS